MIIDLVSQPLPRKAPPKELVNFDEFCDEALAAILSEAPIQSS